MNILFGVVYTLVMVAALARGWYFYTMYGLIEIILSLVVVWYAWAWPKEASNRLQQMWTSPPRGALRLSGASITE